MPAAFDRRERRVDRGEVERDRLLAEDRHAGRGGGADQLDVGVGGRADRHRVDAGGERVSDAVERRDTELGRRRRAASGGDDVVHARRARAGDAPGQQFGVHPADAPASEHPDAHRSRSVVAHSSRSPYWPLARRFGLRSSASRAARIAGRSLTSGTPTSQHAPPSVQAWGSVAITITVVRSARAPARTRVAELGDRARRARAVQPIDAAWAAKSTGTSSPTMRQSASRLLNDAPPWLTCSRSITANPPLSHTTTIIAWPESTERVEVAVHHQVRPVADEHDHSAVRGERRPRHRRAPPAADLVAHAREAVLAVERRRRPRPPAVVQLAREAARRGERVVVGRRRRRDTAPTTWA